ncbi:hypothetical protein V6R21_26185 [Limibacter armeniacum]|uniref:hypothetical protein n=1 Tax=Limibacter armeniacum TaxID=466084 RepID=UPI002FE583F4
MNKLQYTLCLLFGLGSLQASAQNMVPNASFEQIKTETRGHAYLDNVSEWFNTNQRKPKTLYGTPDHMYINKEQSLEGIKASFSPHSGNSVLGLITYMQRVPNYREFASVKLDTHLTKGKKYRCSFYITNGNQVAYGSVASNGLGVAFTSSALEQYLYEPIAVKPQFTIEDILYTKEWKQYSFEFTAQEPYLYMTIGNFFTDDQISLRHMNYDTDPQTYVYLDDISVVAIDGEETIEPEKVEAVIVQKKEEPVVATVSETPIPEPTTEELVENREVEDQYVLNLPAGVSKVKIKIWDDKTEDGDVLSVLFNKHWLVKSYSLRKKKRKLTLNIDNSKDNRLILIAHDLGTEPPTTAAIEIKAGSLKRTIRVRSDLGKCGAIRFQQ